MIKTVSEVKNELNAIASLEEPTLVSKNGKPIMAIVPIQRYQEMYAAWKKMIDLETIERAKAIQTQQRKVISHEDMVKQVEGKNDKELVL